MIELSRDDDRDGEMMMKVIEEMMMVWLSKDDD